MKRRAAAGLTLLEVLLAVALLATVVSGTSWFLLTAAKRAVTSAAVVDERVALAALFAAIDRDLIVGDTDANAVEGKSGRVAVSSDGLWIATRSSTTHVGAVIREYTWRATTRELLSVERARLSATTESSVPTAARVVLGGVVAFATELSPGKESLEVAVELASGAGMRREWSLP